MENNSTFHVLVLDVFEGFFFDLIQLTDRSDRLCEGSSMKVYEKEKLSD